MSDQHGGLPDMRRSYERPPLRRADLAGDWSTQLAKWLAEAQETGIAEPNAMVLATATAEGRPSTRTVLLKDLTDVALTFYTNYGSDKARELSANASCALTFSWPELGRQVNILGRARRGTDEAADRYFASRPHGSKIGALASEQSARIDSRQQLEQRAAELHAQYAPGDDVPRPWNWGGFEVTPSSVEFWQGQPDRLHDRLRYTRTADGAWIVERLSP